jgi:hypothetical protein
MGHEVHSLIYAGRSCPRLNAEAACAPGLYIP